MTDEKEFLPEICKVKHAAIDREIDNIKKDSEEKHEEIKGMITSLGEEVKNSHENLKDKIVLSEKRTGDKIDSLNDFDESLKGNGNPGIWESVRNIKRNIKIILCAIALILILVLGGSYEGVSLDKIKKAFGIEKTVAEQVEEVPVEEEVVVLEEEKPKIIACPENNSDIGEN